ncbi:MAG TPA: 2Fe-2S iron-sulfur cluster-binding protein [Actinomycetota bacterium]|nr:2Fe-2S iron-sulfur cluster-binding protein [Actinomycetota bacterium]
MQLSVIVNGQPRSAEVDPEALLVEALREGFQLTGTKVGCDTSQCGSCCVLVDGVSVKSCTLLAAQAEGREVTTVEGLADHGRLSALQQGFWDEFGLQCGFCTPGMLMSMSDLLSRNRHPDDHEIRSWLDGNLCRCTGYQNVVKAVQRAVKLVNSPVHIVADTPMKQFYEEQVQFLMDKDVDGLVSKHYHDDAVIVSHAGIARGRDQVRARFGTFLHWVTIEEVLSTDNFTETDNTLMFEATIKSSMGVVKTYDAMLLEAGRVKLQFTGSR